MLAMLRNDVLYVWDPNDPGAPKSVDAAMAGPIMPTSSLAVDVLQGRVLKNRWGPTSDDAARRLAEEVREACEKARREVVQAEELAARALEPARRRA